jgi:hypothetical protein
MKKHFFSLLIFTSVTGCYIQAQVPIGAATNVIRPGRDTVRPPATITSQVVRPPVAQNNSQNSGTKNDETTYVNKIIITKLISEEHQVSIFNDLMPGQLRRSIVIQLAGQPVDSVQIAGSVPDGWFFLLRFNYDSEKIEINPLLDNHNYSSQRGSYVEITFPMSKYGEMRSLLAKSLEENKYTLYLMTMASEKRDGSLSHQLANLKIVAK